MILAIIVWIFTAIIVYLFAGKYWWFPPPISQHGMEYDTHFMRVLWGTGIIFFIAQAALGWVIFRFRDDGRRASYTHGNNVMETVWTTATAVLFIGLVLSSTGIWAGVHMAATPENALHVEVLGKQFTWSFRY